MTADAPRPLQAGDVIGDGKDRRVIVQIASAGECIEARIERDIDSIRSERRGIYRG